MKKFLSLGVFIMLCFDVSHAALIDDAVSRANKNNLTIHKTSKDFKVDQNIRRDEAAKFFVNFAKLVGKNVYVKTDSECKFSDMKKSNSGLQSFIIESCKLGLFVGENGKFDPQVLMTNGNVVEKILLLFDSTQSDILYSYKMANELKLLVGTDIKNEKSLLKRGDLIKIMYNARNFYVKKHLDNFFNWMKEYNSWKTVGKVSSRDSSYETSKEIIDYLPKANKICKKEEIYKQFPYPQFIMLGINDKEYNKVGYIIYDLGKSISSLKFDRIVKMKKKLDNIDFKLNEDSIYLAGVSMYYNTSSYKNFPYLAEMNERGTSAIMSDCSILPVSIGLDNSFMLLTNGSSEKYQGLSVNIPLEPKTISNFENALYGTSSNDLSDDESIVASVKYREGYIVVSRNGGNEYSTDYSLKYFIIDKLSFYNIGFSDFSFNFSYCKKDGSCGAEETPESYYTNRLKGDSVKLDGTYPRLVQGKTEEDIIKFFRDIMSGKKTSKYFDSKLNDIKSRIDKLIITSVKK